MFENPFVWMLVFAFIVLVWLPLSLHTRRDSQKLAQQIDTARHERMKAEAMSFRPSHMGQALTAEEAEVVWRIIFVGGTKRHREIFEKDDEYYKSILEKGRSVTGD